jgi:hypothetical protein
VSSALLRLCPALRKTPTATNNSRTLKNPSLIARHHQNSLCPGCEPFLATRGSEKKNLLSRKKCLRGRLRARSHTPRNPPPTWGGSRPSPPSRPTPPNPMPPHPMERFHPRKGWQTPFPPRPTHPGITPQTRRNPSEGYNLLTRTMTTRSGRPYGPTDKAPAYGAGDSGFESR